MSWPFLAVVFSGWLYIDACYRGPNWQRWLFKPLTLLLLLLLAWQSPEKNITSYLILLGLTMALIADALLLLPQQYTMYAIAAFFLTYLFYMLSFANQISFNLYFLLPIGLLVIGLLLLWVIWQYLDNMRWLVISYVVIILLMVWMAGENYFQRSTDVSFSLWVGSILLLLSNIAWLINRYRIHFPAAQAIIAACYFIGHFLIVRSLYL